MRGIKIQYLAGFDKRSEFADSWWVDFEFILNLALFRVYPCASVYSRLRTKKSRRALRPGVWCRVETLAALHGGATGGDERRHIASALHRGSEGAPAISMNPLPAGSVNRQRFI